jgi:hypothetical protein
MNFNDTWLAKKRYLVGLALIAALLIVVFLGYKSLESRSYKKIFPYSLELEVKANAPALIAIQYDYGFGFNKSHQRIVSIEPNDQVQPIKFAVSAWKAIYRLRLATGVSDDIDIKNLSLSQQDYGAVRFSQDELAWSGDGAILLDSIHKRIKSSNP